MKNLVIVESPSKSKTIEKFLGKDYKVVSSKGHIRDLAIKGKDGLGVDVENDFEATYTINKDKKDTVKELKALRKKADNVFLATDPDREGEAISWHLAKELEVDETQANRVIFNEITKDAVLAAFEHPRVIDADLVKSQETRRILDRIIGFKLSKLLKSKIRSKSAGRVQSVALKIIVEREKLIQAFVPKEYWSIKALFKEQKIDFEAVLMKQDNKKITLDNENETKDVLKDLAGAFLLDEVKKTNRRKQPSPVFMTSTLQQTAASKINFNAKKTMRVAQKLYEGIAIGEETEGLITYMRTDSTRMSEGFVSTALEYIQENYGKEYVGKYKNKSADNAQDAHEGIRVTDITRTPESIKSDLSSDEIKLYSLIYARTIASLMAPAKQALVTYTFVKNGYEFVSNGIEMTFDGYTLAYGKYETNKDKILPVLQEKQ
ncbi:MAG: type I DNA topoisomerase, partial [Erysipelothrix sp.]|nr:type I DNA topoisomerase [Erysipelothrix sp.]